MTDPSGDAGGARDVVPLGIGAPPGERPRVVAAVGRYALDCDALARDGLIAPVGIAGWTSLNGWLANPHDDRVAVRARLRELLSDAAGAHERAAVEAALLSRDGLTMALPFATGDFVDFYSSIEHATHVGRLFRPDHPLAENYRYVPIGYHGRAGSLVVDGTPIRRPSGQRRGGAGLPPVFGPSAQLDFELEWGTVIGRPSVQGQPVPIGAAAAHIGGFVLLNDWSARDIQAWETVPLGPFAGKSFATSISAWLIDPAVLAPFRVANRAIDPPPLPYLASDEPWALDIVLTAALQTARMRAAGDEPQIVTRVGFRDMYWNVAQQIAHLTANGAPLRTGDLLGSGTVSGPGPGTYGSLLEATAGGRDPLVLANGEQRRFLEDGDTVELRACAERDGRRLELGCVRGTIVP